MLVALGTRWRLTLLYTLCMAVILLGLGILAGRLTRHAMLSQIDRNLKQSAQSLHSFKSLEQFQQLPSAADGSCLHNHTLTGKAPWHMTLRTSRGKVVFPGSDCTNLPWKPHWGQRSRSEYPFITTITGANNHNSRLLIMPLRLEQQQAPLYLQLAHPLTALNQAQQQIRLAVLLTSPFILLLVATVAWFFAGWSLRPICRISAHLRRIDVENLSERIEHPHTGDEIGQLVTTINSMLQRLEESVIKIKQFSGDASHELRTPLTILRGETEVALHWGKDAEEFRKTLESNMEEVRRMERIIEDLLTLSKSDMQGLQLSLQDISLSDMLQEIYIQGRSLIEDDSIELQLHPQVNHEVTIQGDELRLRQLFLNLVTNAIKYTPAPGSIDIILRQEDPWAVVEFKDTGIGISAEHIKHIFERFYRMDKARNRQHGGNGLGLAIVKTIVEAHGGHIEVTSEPGQGSCFRVKLPLEGPSEPTQEALPS